MVEQHAIQAILKQSAAQIDYWLHDLPSRSLNNGSPSTLAEAMKYSLDGGGKRIRPVLVVWCCELCGGIAEQARAAALAVECIHTFSLIHDDLPAIDNDDLRRGRPTCHRRFTEGHAILAGDALLVLAFELLADASNDPKTALAMVRELSAATGWHGLIHGEAADIEGESRPADAERVRSIHELKTARLIQASCTLGGMAARADEAALIALSNYGYHLGLAFQAADDLLDVTMSCDKMGKRTGKDAACGKQTYPRAVGMDEARRIADEAAEMAIEQLAHFGAKADRLAALARFVVEREC